MAFNISQFLVCLLLASISLAMTGGLRVMSSNAQGLRDSIQRFNVLTQLKSQLTSDVYFLQETHWTKDTKPVVNLLWKREVYISPALDSNSLGVAILLHPNLDCKVISVEEIVEARALLVQFLIRGKPSI